MKRSLWRFPLWLWAIKTILFLIENFIFNLIVFQWTLLSRAAYILQITFIIETSPWSNPRVNDLLKGMMDPMKINGVKSATFWLPEQKKDTFGNGENSICVSHS